MGSAVVNDQVYKYYKFDKFAHLLEDDRMSQREVSIAELRSQLADIVNTIRFANDVVVVTKNNKRAAVIVSPDEYDRLIAPSKRFTQKERQKALANLDTLVKAFRADVPDLDDSTLQDTVQRETTLVRANRRKKNAISKKSIHS